MVGIPTSEIIYSISASPPWTVQRSRQAVVHTRIRVHRKKLSCKKRLVSHLNYVHDASTLYAITCEIIYNLILELLEWSK